MSVDIIIPNYNGSHLIKKNLSSILVALKEYDSKIIIVDDGSKKEDRDSLREIVQNLKDDKKSIFLVEHKNNMGFSSAVNTGVKNSNADIVVLLNSDVVPTKDFLHSSLSKFRNDEKLFGVGCLDKSLEGGNTVLRGVGIGKWEKGMIQHGEGDLNSGKTFWVSGGSSLFRRELYNKLGGMDEIYNPFYWEDVDLSYRAQKAGYKIIFDKDSVVQHLHEEGAIKTHFKKNRVTTIAYRNQFIFIWKNISDLNLIFNHIVLFPVNIIGAIKRKDSYFLKGFLLALLKLPAIIRNRFLQQKLYKVSDGEILRRFL